MPGHFVEPVKRTTAPRTVIAVAYDPLDSRTSASGYTTTAGSWTVRATRRSRDGWEDIRRGHFDAGQESHLWRLIESAVEDHGRGYVVTRCASDALTLAGFWGRVDAGEVSLRLEADTYHDRDGKKRKRRPHPLILSGTPDVIGWSVGKREFKAVSVTNHIGCPLLEAARAVGVADPPDARVWSRPTGHCDPDSAWTAEALIGIYTHLIDWWLAKKAGAWADTIGAAAWQWWRSTLATDEVLEHDVPSAMNMERAAIFGGRAQLFWYGSAGSEGDTRAVETYLDPAVPAHLPGSAWKLDVRSMYAALLLGGRFPARLSHRLRPRSRRDLAEACRMLDVVATVRVGCAKPRLPFHSTDDGVIYPVGEWWTTLTTPELVDTMARGELLDIGDAWAYKTGRPFAEFARQLIQERQDARQAGDGLTEVLCKGVANALGGRLARTFRGWTTIPQRMPRQRWGEWVEGRADGTEVVRYRGVAGMLQQFVSRDERPGGLSAMFATLTAYGRVMIGKLLDIAGRGNVLWVDTDGLIVTTAGKDALAAAGHGHGDHPGELRLVEEVLRFAGRTPKHYQTNRGWVLAGARGDFMPIDGHTVRCHLTANPVRSGQNPSGKGLPTMCPVYHLDAIPLSGTPGPDGWLVDPIIRDGQVIQPRPRDTDTAGELDS